MTLLRESKKTFNLRDIAKDPNFDFRNVNYETIWGKYLILSAESPQNENKNIILFDYVDNKIRDVLYGESYPYAFKNHLVSLKDNHIIIRNDINIILRVISLTMALTEKPVYFSDYIIYYFGIGIYRVANLIKPNYHTLPVDSDILAVFDDVSIEAPPKDSSDNSTGYVILSTFVLYSESFSLVKYNMETGKSIKSLSFHTTINKVLVSDKIYATSKPKPYVYILSLNLECEKVIDVSCNNIDKICKLGNVIVLGGSKLISFRLDECRFVSNSPLSDIAKIHSRNRDNIPQNNIGCCLIKSISISISSSEVLNDQIIKYYTADTTEYKIDNNRVIDLQIVGDRVLAVLRRSSEKLMGWRQLEQDDKNIHLCVYSDKPFNECNMKCVSSKYRELFIQLILIAGRILNVSNVAEVGIPKDIILYIVRLVYYSNVYY